MVIKHNKHCIFDRISFRSKYSFNFLALNSALKDGKLFGKALLVLPLLQYALL